VVKRCCVKKRCLAGKIQPDFFTKKSQLIFGFVEKVAAKIAQYSIHNQHSQKARQSFLKLHLDLNLAKTGLGFARVWCQSNHKSLRRGHF